MARKKANSVSKGDSGTPSSKRRKGNGRAAESSGVSGVSGASGAAQRPSKRSPTSNTGLSAAETKLLRELQAKMKSNTSGAVQAQQDESKSRPSAYVFIQLASSCS